MPDLTARLAAAEEKVASAQPGLPMTVALRELDRVRREIRAAETGHNVDRLY